ncbi:hypothetical protein [Blastopirellula marina]|uniref:Carboxypeptidase regulatory-like domain-containing protein n=1 Tax=Blastopirellula marina TaxID=124 RepID=A0A2S8GHY3_9BACT|nr:hypothetical protein [Blastopirellula marina]PQO44063.1 hypothetical protein C5Y93_21215 [Blastopirellula marina]
MPSTTFASRLLVVAILAAVGCSSANDGPQRYRIQGEITYDGKPLPGGRISFAPDTELGNSGPEGYADIIDGYYDTNNGGKGVVPGAHNVRIEGYDGEPSPRNDFYRYGNMVFRVHRDKIEVPEKASSKNFDVPDPPNEE